VSLLATDTTKLTALLRRLATRRGFERCRRAEQLLPPPPSPPWVLAVVSVLSTAAAAAAAAAAAVEPWRGCV